MGRLVWERAGKSALGRSLMAPGSASSEERWVAAELGFAALATSCSKAVERKSELWDWIVAAVGPPDRASAGKASAGRQWAFEADVAA